MHDPSPGPGTGPESSPESDIETGPESDLTDAAPALPRQIVRLSEPGRHGPLPVLLTPDTAGRAAIARHLGLRDLRKLRFDGHLIPSGKRDWTLDAMLGATVVQDCVVTLAPVVTRIDEPVIRRYLADLPEPAIGEVEMPEDDTVEDLPATLDLCAVMIEALSLALPPFPRADGAELGALTVTEPGALPLDADAVRPFAGLASLRDKLSDPGADDA